MHRSQSQPSFGILWLTRMPSRGESFTSQDDSAFVSNLCCLLGSRMYISKSDSITITGGVFADNRIAAVEIRDAERITVQNSVILGETVNTGNPSGCNNNRNSFANCEPLKGSCSLPVPVSQARSLGAGRVARNIPMFGVILTQGEYPTDALTAKFSQGYYPLPNLISNVYFKGFNRRCKVEAAISGLLSFLPTFFSICPNCCVVLSSANGEQLERFMPTHKLEKLKFLDSSPRVYMAPRSKGLTRAAKFTDSGPTSYSYAIRDKDGSTIGSTGFIVANTKALITKNCKVLTLVPMNGNNDNVYSFSMDRELLVAPMDGYVLRLAFDN